MLYRPRRLRQSSAIRTLIEEHSCSIKDFIYPVFLLENSNDISEIPSMPGIYRYGINTLIKHLEPLVQQGLSSILIFPVINSQYKDDLGSYALNKSAFFYSCFQKLKETFLDKLFIFGDIALDPFTTHGHDGLLTINREIDNDKTTDVLSAIALLMAKSGIDGVAPSDMMDGRVEVIRNNFEIHNFKNTVIMSYTAKYASNLYAPFRDALNSTPKGDKKTYQMSYSNSFEADRELSLDFKEGADIIMVKPGIFYLDILYRYKQKSQCPVAIYQTSGEYAMLHHAIHNGFSENLLIENLCSFKRAGADIIISYWVPYLLKNKLI